MDSKHPLFHFDTEHIEWQHLQDLSGEVPIDYRIALLGSDPKMGSLDLLVKFEPNSYCHFHRHVAATTTLVLEGEQHLFEPVEGGEPRHKVRKAGTYARAYGDDVHMECGGPEGALVFFAMQAHEDGKVFDLLDKDANTLSSSTVGEIAAGTLELQGARR